MQFTDLRGRLPIHPTARYGFRPLSGILGACWHYSGKDADCSAADIARYHISQNGWPGAGYTLVVRRTGEIELAHSLDVLSWHADGGQGQLDGEGNLVGVNNWEWVGVCLPGLSGFTEAQIDAAVDVADWLEDELGRAMLHVGHRHLKVNTVCPGEGWDQLYPRLLLWR